MWEKNPEAWEPRPQGFCFLQYGGTPLFAGLLMGSICRKAASAKSIVAAGTNDTVFVQQSWFGSSHGAHKITVLS